ERRTGFAWGAGVQFNPVENVVIDLGYEGSKSWRSETERR
ncbi:resistance to complement killing, partial [Salmonella enterica subsp. enterica serovar Enteritidis str. CDC_2010K_1594]